MSVHCNHNQKAGQGWGKTGCFLLLIFLVFISAGACGCIKLIQQSTGNTGTQPEALHPDPVKTVAISVPVTHARKISPAQPTITLTATTPDLITDAAPILPPDPYPVQHAMQINETPLTNRHVRYAEATRIYVLRGNSTGLVVNATVLEGPLWIAFNVKPLYDCLEDVESCRGDEAKTISRPYFTLTVRDNQTREIVAEDGYGEVYSLQKENRTIKIYKEGQYHLTLTGNSVDVTLEVATGAAPCINEMQSAGPAATAVMSPEYQRYLRQTGHST